jgi:protein disulfide-isomerase
MRTLRTLAVFGWVVALTTSAVAQSQIPWLTDWRQARDLAQQQHRLVLLHFWSETCAPCKRLEQHVFNRPEVGRAMSSGYIPVKINVDEQPQLAKHYQVEAWPTDVIVDPSGRVVYRQVSPQDANQYIAMLDQMKAHWGASLAGAVDDSGRAPVDLTRPGAAEGSTLSLAGQPTPPRSNPQSTSTFLGLQSPSRNGGIDAGGAPASSNPLAETAAQTAPVARPYANPFLSPPAPTQPSLNTADAMGPSTQHSSATGNQWTSPSGSVVVENPHMKDGVPVGHAASPPSAPANPAPGTNQWTQNAPPQASAAQIASRAPLPSPLPTNTALDGYCPVTLVEQNTWSKGDTRWGANHRGRTYLFTNYVNQQRFLANPDLFSPMLSGFDPVRYFDGGEVVSGKREHGLYYGDKYFLFADEGSLERFRSDPQRYVAQSQSAMQSR